jgi:dTMP kinase
MRKIISIEGGDGSGKSVMLRKIREELDGRDISYIVTREPGGVEISEKIREIILNPEHTQMDAKTEALLFAAARRQHLVEKVIPAVERGQVVIFDRYVDSSVVYQGYVRGLGMEEVYQMNLFATEGFLPGLTIVLDLDPMIGLQRITDNNREEDRLDQEGVDFHTRVREGYLNIAKEDPERIKLIDASQEVAEVFSDIMKQIDAYLEV